MDPKPLHLRHAPLGSLSAPRAAVRRRGHRHHWLPALSRRGFLGTAAGAASALLSSGLWSPAWGADDDDDDDCPAPRPIPGGFPYGNHFYHLRTPEHPVFGTGSAETEDPSSITHFNGNVGLAYVTGMGTHTDKLTGAVTRLPFEVDLRFMTGTYVGTDRRRHHGAFALIWLDVFDGSGSQIHDFNPGIEEFDPNVADTGLFWTTCIDEDAVEVNPDNGRAAMTVRDLAMPDYFTFDNAAVLGPSEPGIVSFDIKWERSRDRRRFRHGAGTPDQWRANMVINEARAAWEGETARAHYISDRPATSASIFAEVGHERNGVFFA